MVEWENEEKKLNENGQGQKKPEVIRPEPAKQKDDTGAR
jgi:hypothetical protein